MEKTRNNIFRRNIMRDGTKVKGIRIRSLNYFTVIVACILYVLLIYGMINISTRYQSLLSTTQDYITCEKDAALLSAASDYLTEQVRLYAINQDPKYVTAYFEEINVTKRRDRALADLEQYHSNDQVYEALQCALERSNALMETEFYSMKLITIACGYDLSTFPLRIQDIALSPEDNALDCEAMLERARQMVFDEEYQEAKSEIQNCVNQVIEPILSYTEQKHLVSSKKLKSAIARDQMILNILMVTNIFSFLAITVLVIRPLNHYSKCINSEKPLDVSGAYEFQYLAHTYNDVYARNAENETVLRKKAERDGLTGLLNRGAFDQLTSDLEDSTDPLVLLLIDVDDFKMVNDHYGHDVGDQILKKVALTLNEHFHFANSIARIGGDEFSVILTDTTQSLQPVIQQSVDRVNEHLTHPKDGLPPVSLSIGAVFSDAGYRRSLYTEADQALYQVKEHGRCGCHFYNAKE
jgi:diguanylate cyclase (GGDEF)-like protein